MDHISARSNDSDSLQAFIRMYFVAHGIMNRTVSDRRFDQNNALCWSVVDDLDEVCSIAINSKTSSDHGNDID